MKKYLIFVLFLVSFQSYSQDTTDFSIKPKWVNPEINEIKKDSILVNEKVLESKSIIGDIIEKITPSWVAPEKIFETPKEELSQSEVKLLEAANYNKEVAEYNEMHKLYPEKLF